MKIFDSRKSIVMASIGVLFATLALVSCEKREEPLLNDMAKYSKTVVFTEQQTQTRTIAYTDYNTQIPDADYVLRAEESTDSMFLSAYVTDLESEQLMTRADETTTENLGQFRILAYNVGSDNSLGINEGLSQLVGKNSDGTWSYGAITNQSEKNWSELGNNTVKFYAYANLPTAEGAVSNTGLPSTQFRLTLPTNATEQTDIIVAEAAGTYQSTNTQQVPLQFNHILAGIKFIVGDKNTREEIDANGNKVVKEGVSGYIKSIKINNVVSQGLFDIQTQEWSNLNSTNTETLIAAENLTSNGASGDQVGSTLMVIPQKLGTNAVLLEVTFVASGNASGANKEQKLSVYLSGEWKAGEMYTYKISNSKVDLLEFTSKPDVQDAHYVICPITIRLDAGLRSASLKAEWKDMEGNPINGEPIEMRESLTPYESQGYWIDNDIYAQLSSTPKLTDDAKANLVSRYEWLLEWTSDITATTTKTVYLFIPENASSNDRNIVLTLTGTKDNNAGSATAKTQIIKQFCPTESGCERIEETRTVPWGPYWKISGNNGSKEVTYSASLDSALDNFLGYVLLGLYGMDQNNWPIGVKFKYQTILFFPVLTGVTIDYSQYLTFDQSGNDDNGLLNTQQVFGGELNANQANMDDLLAIQDALKNSGLNPPSGVVVDPVLDVDGSAIVSAVIKNKYSLELYGDDEKSVKPVIANTDIKWYLPSITEIPTALSVKEEEGEHSLSGIYWSSTISDGDLSMSHSKAYTWPSGPVINKERDNSSDLRCRAVRVVDWN